jgi:alpha-D-ribose 1-methylphosphonate 5-triphosphate diphosphatase
MVSLMDHTPGQGQFKTLQSYVDYQIGTYNLSRKEIDCLLDRKKKVKEVSWNTIKEISSRVKDAEVPFLSHDDDSPEKVDMVKKLGVTACEFPVTMAAARAARESHMQVLMGAPNLIRDKSTNGNLKSSDTIVNELCDGLVSDYYPECLIQTPFLAGRHLSIELEKLLPLVTSGPGKYLNAQDGPGKLEPGAVADIILLDISGPWVQVTETWVRGSCIYSTAK